ncbi:hypothetical protein H6G36_29170 [Anabaena minutissima FACHB-250]|nr:hypothetical protein [Anabaena minutissima FACHB-250]
MAKGGRTSTTWTSGSSWQSGETKTVRIPIALEAKIMAYARALDSGEAVLHGNSQEIILSAIAAYIELRKSSRHNNQFNQGRELDTNVRTWDELRKFKQMVINNPELLEIPSVKLIN